MDTLTLMYVAAGLTVAYFGGIVMERFRSKRGVKEYVWKIHMGEAALPQPDASLAGRHPSGRKPACRCGTSFSRTTCQLTGSNP